MGIAGLASYMDKHSSDFMKKYKLHDCPLVIDGNNILHQLFVDSGSDYKCGGNYTKYAQHVSLFLTKLLQCKITPIVIMDGGWEEKKMCTMYNRLKERIERAADEKSCPKHKIILPILAKHVFKFVIKEKGVDLIQTMFEADDHIGALAKSLDCPVLSSDSDFYIYDVQVIPFKTLNPLISYSQAMQLLYIECQVFKSENFLSKFPEMNKKNLPLLAVLLGNDYVDPTTFKDFFLTLKVPKDLVKEHSDGKQHLMITSVLFFLEKHSLPQALNQIMRTINLSEHLSVLKNIETCMNGYIVPPMTMDNIFQMLPDQLRPVKQKLAVEPYDFVALELEISTSNDQELILNEDETYLGCHPESKNVYSLDESKKLAFPVTKYKTLPEWYTLKYSIAEVPPDFNVIIFRQTIIFGQCIEDFSLPPSVRVCFKIISVIQKLLLNQGTSNCNDLKYVSRGNGSECMEVIVDTIPPLNYDFPFELPTLEKLKGLEPSLKAQILSISLGVHRSLVEFPPSWRLYVATIRYWICESKSILVTRSHIYPLIMSMIFHIVQKITLYGYYPTGKFESLTSHKNYGCPHKFVQVSISDLLENLETHECLVMEKKLMTRAARKMNLAKFDKRVIHVFSSFQYCLESAINLNALLDFPYSADINQSELFNGTLIYNFYHEFRAQHDFNEFLDDFFLNSPSLSQLFMSLVTKILELVK
ncbi:hypothetical protein QAD02_011230 [Eretmocerus hayati]|uniref:Uncharacterized protein n=1 Tax=Eretmocerus hayati TaxID=131215 RepID=A0ACC2NW10_9HYME|nr:hypothetical protein QAD02_011230 [Eretmocerus hayati]